MVKYVPKLERSGVDFTISTDFTGSNGASGRTYTLQNSNSVIEGLTVVASGATLVPGDGISFSDGVITFTNAVFDSFTITINYFVESITSSGTDTDYATTLQLVKYMNAVGDTIDNGANNFLEEVGTGNNSQKIFLLDHKGVVSGTYSVYYGASAEASLSNELTETTHYTLDKDSGKLVLTSAGVTLVGTNNLYADYKYNVFELPESELQNALNRAAVEVDSITSTHFADVTEATPDWVKVSNETHKGRGAYNRVYFVDERPIPDVSTTLSSDEAVGSTTLNVVSTSGFPSNGTLSIGGEKVAYSEKSSNTFTCTALTSTHSSGDEVLPYCFEGSSTYEGSSPTWTVLEKNKDYEIDFKTGRVYFATSDFNITDAQAWELNPPLNVPKRFRASYISGFSEIPSDVTKATLMLASNDLMHGAVRSATVRGLDDFRPNLVDVDKDHVKSLLKEYVQGQMGSIN